MNLDISFARIRLLRSGNAFSEFDNTSLESCGIINNDVISLEDVIYSNTNGIPSISRISTSGILPETSLQFFVMLSHAIMLDMKFICTFETPSTVKGFAPARFGIYYIICIVSYE
jgi:hypothetical protein